MCAICATATTTQSPSPRNVHVGAEVVVWSRISLESYNYTPEGSELDVRREPAGFTFDAKEYRRVLADPRRSLRRLP